MNFSNHTHDFFGTLKESDVLLLDELEPSSEASLEELEKADIFEADSYLIHLMSSINK